MSTITYLSLFSGACGGDLGVQQLLGWKCKGYVEYEKYCQKIIKQRIKDGLLDAAPIFGDINNFISEGYAEIYKGMVIGITAGFPCPPFSVAGKRKGADDPRNMWPQTIEVVQIVKPEYVFLENVSGLLSSKSGVDEITGRPISYCTTIFRDLVEAGYNSVWKMLGASDIGAPHRRKRLWILAYTNKTRQRK